MKLKISFEEYVREQNMCLQQPKIGMFFFGRVFPNLTTTIQIQYSPSSGPTQHVPWSVELAQRILDISLQQLL